MSVIITETVFYPAKALEAFEKSVSGAGAVVSFTGRVRDEGGAVATLSLSHYPAMTQAEIAKAGERAAQRWNLLDWHVIHRVGDMHPGEAIVFVATASAHRRAAFEAADYLMDYLKSDAPFWKSETRGDVKTWIEPTERDREDRNRWEQD